MDDGIGIPGTGLRIGLDPIIGLVPGVGDVAGAVVSFSILVAAARRGVSRYTLTRMAVNVALDAVLGAVPLVGDVLDAAWKANVRNLALLERHAAAPAGARAADRLFVGVVFGALAALCGALLIGGALLSVVLIRALATP